MTTGIDKKSKKEQDHRLLALRRQSWFLHKNSTSQNTNKWRVRRYHLFLTPSRTAVISLRRFRTQKANRSKNYKQVVFSLRLFSIREVAIGYRSRKRRHKKQRKILVFLPHNYMIPIATIVIGICGMIFFGININKPRALEPIVSNSASTPIVKQVKKSDFTKTLPRSQPTRLRIPKINVDTSLVTLSRKADGSMETPTDFFTAGWYKYSPTPGELGPSIIAGHVDSYGGLAVFWRLRELQLNDVVYVERADGKIAKFRVNKVGQYPKNNFPTSTIYGDIDYAGIRLITCGGVYNYQARDYTDNLVIFGSLIN